MNDNNEKKVRRGEPVRIPAATWNNIIDAMKHHKRGRFNKANSVNDGDLTDLIKSNTTILLRNASGYEFSVSFKIFRLSGTVLDIAADPLEGNRRMAFNGFIPNAIDNAIAIAQVPLDVEDIGKSITSGISVCKVKIVDTGHQWCNPTPGTADYLTSSVDGQARIFWFGPSGDAEELAAGIYLAVVHLIGVVGAEGNSVDVDIVTNICPIYEDVTYDQGIDELTDLLTHIEGYATGRVLGVNELGELEWIDVSTGPENYAEETPAGTINGSNAVFTLTHIPISLNLFLNGIRQRNGIGNDFQIIGSTITYEAGAIPQSGDSHIASYAY